MLAEIEIQCTPGTAAGRIYREFGADSRGDGTYELSVSLENLGLPAIGKLSRTAFVKLGAAQRREADNATLIPVQWHDLESDSFPTFHGEIEIVPLGSELVQVAIIGDYKPPFGPLGAVFDAAVGKAIAEATTRELLERLRKALETSEKQPQTAGAAPNYPPTYE